MMNIKIEHDKATGLLAGSVPGIPGAHRPVGKIRVKTCHIAIFV